MGTGAGRFLHQYLKYFWIFSVVWLSVATRLMYRKFNFAEHLAINSFVIGQATLVAIIGFFLFTKVLIFNPVIYVFIIWILSKIYNQSPHRSDNIIMAFCVVVVFFILLAILVTIIGFLSTKMM